MSRGSTLTTLVDMLRKEIGASSDPAVGVNSKEVLIQTLNRTQNRLFFKYDWHFLKVIHNKLTQAGSRYYDVPTTMNAERIIDVNVKYSNIWQPLSRGIDLSHYNQYDSDSDERSDPPRCWEIYGKNQIEVWPLPATNDLPIRIQGVQKVKEMIYGSDTAVLDDDLIVLFAAAEILRRKKRKDADLKLAEANDLFITLKGRIHGKRAITFATTPRAVRRGYPMPEWSGG